MEHLTLATRMRAQADDVHSSAVCAVVGVPASLQHDPNKPEDVHRVDADGEGIGGDDPADACRMTKSVF